VPGQVSVKSNPHLFAGLIRKKGQAKRALFWRKGNVYTVWSQALPGFKPKTNRQKIGFIF
jgi:hypothetical protein